MGRVHRRRHAGPHAPPGGPLTPADPAFTLVDGDLLDQDVDVIVNAWNRNVIPWWLLIPQGVAGAIRRRAGTQPFREVARYGPIPLGEARLTGAGRLPHRAIVHVAGISLAWRSSEAAIRSGTRNAHAVALAAGFASVAYPILGAGTGGFPEARALAIMGEELERLRGLRVVVVRFPGPTRGA